MQPVSSGRNILTGAGFQKQLSATDEKLQKISLYYLDPKKDGKGALEALKQKMAEGWEYGGDIEELERTINIFPYLFREVKKFTLLSPEEAAHIQERYDPNKKISAMHTKEISTKDAVLEEVIINSIEFTSPDLLERFNGEINYDAPIRFASWIAEKTNDNRYIWRSALLTDQNEIERLLIFLLNREGVTDIPSIHINVNSYGNSEEEMAIIKVCKTQGISLEMLHRKFSIHNINSYVLPIYPKEANHIIDIQSQGAHNRTTEEIGEEIELTSPDQLSRLKEDLRYNDPIKCDSKFFWLENKRLRFKKGENSQPNNSMWITEKTGDNRYIWRSTFIIDCQEFEKLLTFLLNIERGTDIPSIHINAGSHGSVEGETANTMGAFLVDLAISKSVLMALIKVCKKQGISLKMSKEKFSIHNINSYVPPIYPKEANHIIDVQSQGAHSRITQGIGLEEDLDFMGLTDAGKNEQREHAVKAIQSGDEEELKKILKRKININAFVEGGGTLIHIAAESGNKKATDLLINQGADIHRPNEHGETPLLAAIKGDNKGVVRLLIERVKRTDINRTLESLMAVLKSTDTPSFSKALAAGNFLQQNQLKHNLL